MSLEQLFAGRPMDIPAMLRRLTQVAAAEQLPFGARTHTFNSRKAQQLGKWAETQGVGDAFHLAVFQAYFARGENIALQPVLLDIAQSVGLQRQAAAQALSDHRFAAAVDTDWADSRQLGINAVPTLLMGDHRLVGAASEAEMQQLLQLAGCQPRGS